MPRVVVALLDGASWIWDWTAVYEGPPTYDFEQDGRRLSFDDHAAGAIHRDWLKVGGDMRRAMEVTGRPGVGERQPQPATPAGPERAATPTGGLPADPSQRSAPVVD